MEEDNLKDANNPDKDANDLGVDLVKSTVTQLLDDYFKRVEEKFPEVKKSVELVKDVRKSIEEMMEHLDVASLKEAAEKDIREIGSRVSKGSKAESGAHGVLPPKSNMLVMLAKVGDESKTFSADTFLSLKDELEPIIRVHGQETAMSIIEDTLMLLYDFFAGKLSDVLVPTLIDVIGDTVFPDVKDSPDMEKLTRFLVDSALSMVPKAIKGKDIKKESANVSKKFTAKASTILVKVNAPDDVRVDEKNVEKMFDIIVQLGYNMVFGVMMADGEAKDLVVPVLKDVIKLLADVIPNDLLD